MNVHANSALIPDVLPGLAHRTLAGPEHGLSQLEVWSQEIAAHGATPPHRHDCEEVIMIASGAGVLRIEGGEQHFRAGDTVVIPRNVDHQVLNTGDTPLRLVAALAMAPVLAVFPDGKAIDLPWQQPAFQAAGLQA